MRQSTSADERSSIQRRVLLDPRDGDVEDDAASPGQRSLLAIAGSLLVEISLPKLLFAWTALLLLPAVLLGLAPLLASAWLSILSEKILILTEIGAALMLIAIVALGWFAWRPLLRIVETSFWSLNALAVQPSYAFCREALRHLTERIWQNSLTPNLRMRVRRACSLGAGILLSAGAALIAILVWPASQWTAGLIDLALGHHLVVTTLANAVVLVSCYLAAASLAWGFADASMDQPADLAAFDIPRSDARIWRVAHLSDVHVVGERYGFRIECGRAGPRGNERFAAALARLAAIHAADPLDHVLISGDMTDAGRASEWAEFLEALSEHPDLAARTLLLPGNHDVNIVDRANPARLDLPFSPGKRLRQMRTLSAISAIQGDRVRLVDTSGKVAATLDELLTPHREQIVAFAERGGVRRGAELRRLFEDQFPMILAPEQEEGLGIAILDSNAETHFSFTNALGLVSLEQVQRLEAAMNYFPKARWIVALHHHCTEYPMPTTKFSERIGTALINGSWFVRRLQAFADRVVVMHGHRHIDWIGACGALKIISAPSPVMNATDDAPTHFYIHRLASGPGGTLCLAAPEKVEIAGS
ncbi:metallophosphoesterase [Bradyrhizobium neotropicale]|uniref:metallophosphoesterase family protein n=1 Tax=Bradyrhizobium neotropicale TaxID=1497615 RepID=UPI001AD6A9F6|nr:metallophosphoesterase [Bradyrhizobium neotropicale]MBO4227022.1 metallophosphoesterase [Bradyrhizobium neotropicale]